MSPPDCLDDSADQLYQQLRALAKSLGVNPDAPDVVVQFSAALLLATLRLVSLGQSQSPTISRRKPTWQAGLYEELYRDVTQTKADLNCSIKDAIADLRKDRTGRWWKHTQQSLETRYREARSHARDALRDRIARLLVQQASSPQAWKSP
jgi:hypothetical protein